MKCHSPVNQELAPDGTTGVTFEEVEQHFKTNSDEACLLASAGNVSTVGDAQKRTHEKETGNSRVSIALLECSSRQCRWRGWGDVFPHEWPDRYVPPVALTYYSLL